MKKRIIRFLAGMAAAAVLAAGVSVLAQETPVTENNPLAEYLIRHNLEYISENTSITDEPGLELQPEARPPVQETKNNVLLTAYEELDKRAEAASEYAREQLCTTYNLKANAIRAANCQVQILEKKAVFQVGFIYQPGEEKIHYKYGYDVEMDDEYNCIILAESSEKGYEYVREAEEVLTIEEVKMLHADSENLEVNLTEKYTGERLNRRIDGKILGPEIEYVQYRVEDDYVILMTRLGENAERVFSLMDTKDTEKFERGIVLGKGDIEEFFYECQLYRTGNPTPERLYIEREGMLVKAQYMKMLVKLRESGYLPDCALMVGISDSRPYGINVTFTLSDLMGRPAVCDPQEWDYRLTAAGNILLALIGDLEEVTFTYRLENGEEYHLYWDVESAKVSLNGEDVKNYADSLEKFQELFTL